MKNIFKRILALMIAFAVIPISGVMAEASYEVILNTDFNNGRAVFKTQNGAKVTSYDDEHGKSLMLPIEEKKAAAIKLDLKKPIQSGILYVGYDYLRTGTEGRGFDVLYHLPEKEVKWSEKGVSVLSCYWDQGRETYCDDLDITQTLYQDLPQNPAVAVNTWHHMDFYVDLQNRIVTAYRDGDIFYRTDDIVGTLEKIYSLGRVTEYRKAAATEYYDNYKIIHYKNAVDRSVLADNAAVPEYLNAGLYAEINTGRLGNNYFSKDLAFKLELNNLLGKKQKVTAKIKIVNTEGNTLYDEEKHLTVGAKGQISTDIPFTAPMYGFYDVIVEITPTYTVKTRLSSIKKSEKQNYFIGNSDHLDTHNLGFKEIDRKLELFKNAGMGLSRGSVIENWTVMENGKHSPDALWRYEKIFDSLEANNIEYVVLLDGDRTRLPAADEHKLTENWKEYVASTASAIKDKVTYYEVTNEPNYQKKYKGDLVKTNYLHLCRITYEAAKKVDPDCKIMALSLCEFDFGYVEAFLEAGGGKYMDGISIHPYMLMQSPEAGGMREKMLELRALMEKYGCGDKEIYVTEIGYTDAPGWSTTRQKAAYTLRAQIAIDHLVDMMIYYNAQRKDYSSEMENNFGFINGDAYEGEEEVPYGANRTFLAMSQWNSLMTNARYVKRIESDDKIRLEQYKTEEGKDVLLAYTTDEEAKREIGLILGAQDVELIDMLGNSQTLNADEGVLSLSLTYEPVYIVGEFSKTELCDSRYSFPVSTIKMVSGETAELDVQAGGADIEVYAADSLEVTCSNTTVSVKSQANHSENEKVSLKILKNNGLVYSAICDVEYIDGASYSVEYLPYTTKKAWADIEFKNYRGVPVNIKLTLEAPTELAKEYMVENIEPYGTSNLRIDIPYELQTKRKIDLKGSFTVESINGNTNQDFDASVTPGTVFYTETPPQIDGKVNNGEWIKALPIYVNATDSDGTFSMNVETADDLSGKVYLMCDDDYFYLSAEIKDDILYDDFPVSDVWRNDSIQFGFAPEAKAGLGRTEINLGMVQGAPGLSRTAFMSNPVMDYTAEDIEYAVNYDNNTKTCYYEIKLPWQECYDADFSPRSVGKIAFSICFNDNDGVGVNNDDKVGRGYFEYIGGIGSSKNSGLFKAFPIIKIKK